MLYEVFKIVLLDSSSRIRTIMTSDQPFVIATMDRIVQSGLYSGSLVLNPKYTLLPSFLKLSVLESKIRHKLEKATSTRSKVEYERCVAQMTECDPNQGNLILTLIKSKPSIFYCQTGETFMGLQPNNWEVIS